MRIGGGWGNILATLCQHKTDHSWGEVLLVRLMGESASKYSLHERLHVLFHRQRLAYA